MNKVYELTNQVSRILTQVETLQTNFEETLRLIKTLEERVSKLEHGQNLDDIWAQTAKESLEDIKYHCEVQKMDPMEPDSNGRTLLHEAAIAGRTDIVRYLIEERGNHVDVTDNRGETALHLAARAGKDHIVKYLCEEAHANPKVLNEDHQTPLDCAPMPLLKSYLQDYKTTYIREQKPTDTESEIDLDSDASTVSTKEHKKMNRFSIEEDRKLYKICMAKIKETGRRTFTAEEWEEISDQIPGRTKKQCSARWKTSLDPNINKSSWSDKEDRIILEKYAEIGPRWRDIAVLCNRRTGFQVRTRYDQLTRKPK